MELNQTSTSKILLSYQGPFIIDELSKFGFLIRSFDFLKSCTKHKLFKVFIELTQNVALYSEERMELKSLAKVGIGSFMIKEYDSYILLETNNRIKKQHGAILANYCIEMNKFTVPELRDLKACKRRHTEEPSTGAHIGLIQICIMSLNPVNYEISEIDNISSSFRVISKINKFYE